MLLCGGKMWKSISEVLDRWSNGNLNLNRKKCHFRVPEVRCVGHVLSAEGVKLEPSEAVIAMPSPACREDLQRFLSVVTYFSRFISNISQKSAPLHQLLQRYNEWSWGKVEENTFTCLKTQFNLLSSGPQVLQPKEPMTLFVDASSKGVGAVLLQNDGPVA